LLFEQCIEKVSVGVHLFYCFGGGGGGGGGSGGLGVAAMVGIVVVVVVVVLVVLVLSVNQWRDKIHLCENKFHSSWEPSSFSATQKFPAVYIA
jgi:uncharacterized membrane protein